MATLAACPACLPSLRWLGQDASSPTVRRSGLWNSQGVNTPPLTTGDRNRLGILAEQGAAA